MCCFLPVHSWHSSLPFSFFDCDFFFSLALIVKPRVHSQPSPTAPVWLSHRKLGFLYSLLSHSPCMTTVCVPLSFSLYVSLCRYVSPICLLAVCFILFCPSALVNLPLCLNFSSLFLLFSSNTHTHTHTHTHTYTYTPPSLFPCLSVCHSQRTGLAGGVQLGSTNTWLSICLLVCAGMVFLFLCCSCFLFDLLFLLRTYLEKN